MEGLLSTGPTPSSLNYIVSKIDTSKYSVFSDISGYQATNGGTIPVTMTVTQLKPDLVIVNEKEKTVDIFELTVHSRVQFKFFS